MVASTTGVSRASTSASTSISDSPGRALLYKHSQSVLTVRRAGLAGLSMLLIGGVLGLMLTPASAPSSITGRTHARSQPVFGTCPAQPSAAAPLRWGSNPSTADHICCKNHRYAEYSGYWTSTSFPMTATEGAAPLTFYDPTTGRPLFVAPRGRSYAEFISESKHHGRENCQIQRPTHTPPRSEPQPLCLARLAELPRCRGRLGECRRGQGRRDNQRERHTPRPQHPRRLREPLLHQHRVRGRSASPVILGTAGTESTVNHPFQELAVASRLTYVPQACQMSPTGHRTRSSWDPGVRLVGYRNLSFSTAEARSHRVRLPARGWLRNC